MIGALSKENIANINKYTKLAPLPFEWIDGSERMPL